MLISITGRDKAQVDCHIGFSASKIRCFPNNAVICWSDSLIQVFRIEFDSDKSVLTKVGSPVYISNGLSADMHFNSPDSLIVATAFPFHSYRIKIPQAGDVAYVNLLQNSDEDIVPFYHCSWCSACHNVPIDVCFTSEEISNAARNSLTEYLSPCLSLPLDSWENPRLSADNAGNPHCCPSCNRMIRFNPWIISCNLKLDSNAAVPKSATPFEPQDHV